MVWRFSSFFSRVKHQVQEHWHPEEAYRQRDPTFSVYGRGSRLTILRVHLKPNGQLVNAAVARTSGVWFLDQEALRAFRSAQPFPNPPRQLVDGGLIDFRFGFRFDMLRNIESARAVASDVEADGRGQGNEGPAADESCTRR